jgi:hypothetical protein
MFKCPNCDPSTPWRIACHCRPHAEGAPLLPVIAGAPCDRGLWFAVPPRKTPLPARIVLAPCDRRFASTRGLKAASRIVPLTALWRASCPPARGFAAGGIRWPAIRPLAGSAAFRSTLRTAHTALRRRRVSRLRRHPHAPRRNAFTTTARTGILPTLRRHPAAALVSKRPARTIFVHLVATCVFRALLALRVKYGRSAAVTPAAAAAIHATTIRRLERPLRRPPPLPLCVSAGAFRSSHRASVLPRPPGPSATFENTRIRRLFAFVCLIISTLRESQCKPKTSTWQPA